MPDPEKEELGSQPAAPDEAGETETPKLNLEVDVQQRSACERHIRVTIPREEIDRYFDKEFGELMGKALVPGFRPGRAPRKLVEAKFRKDVTDRVKSNLLMESIAQLTEEQDLSAISEPDFDLEAVEVPEQGPMTFEFDLEVRPEFDLPKWKGMSLDRPVREFTPADVDRALQNMLARRGRLVPHDGPAQSGDYVVANLTFKDGERVISQSSEETIRLRPVLSFRDGRIEKFDQTLAGVRGGETREAAAHISGDAPNVALRGKTVAAIFEVLEVKKLEVPELTPEFLQELGGFDDEADLRDAILDSLKRRLEYYQHQRAREQIAATLIEAAKWDLPPGLLQRQSRRELARAVMELQRSGFGEEEIRARENELRQNSAESTARALKEHFILERIAEQEKIEPTDDDYEQEVRLIAAQSEESPRRVRARLEKEGMMDVLHNQVIERMVVELILQHAEFKEVPYKPEDLEAEALEQAMGGEAAEESAIPEARSETAKKAESSSEGSHE